MDKPRHFDGRILGAWSAVMRAGVKVATFPVWSFLLVFLAAGSVWAYDPVSPQISRKPTPQKTNLFSLSELELEKNRLELELARLPPIHPGILNNGFGYHSAILPPLAPGEVASERWVKVKLRRRFTLEALCLIPAFNPGTGANRSYGFPRRFSIDLINTETGQHKTVVDWRNEDFPDPGMSPVTFILPEPHKADVVQVNVLKGADDERGRFYAFSELLVITKPSGEKQGRNCAPWPKTMIECSDQLDAQPYWNPAYLNDQIHSLGQYLGVERTDHRGFMLQLPKNHITRDHPLVMDLDLGEVVKPQHMEIYSTRPATDVALPTYGYPVNFILEISPHPDFARNGRRFSYNRASRIPSDSHIHTIFLAGRETRYLRLTITDLPEVDGHQYLALGEIAIRMRDYSFAEIKGIKISGLPQGIDPDLSALTDGYSNGRKIIPEWEWIQQMTMRRMLGKELEGVQSQIHQVVFARSIAIKWVVVGSILILLAWIFIQYRLRRKALLEQRQRITRDLHDDVGSSIGSINLAIDRLSTNVTDPDVSEDLSEISLNIREAASSLKEIFRFEDQRVINLPILMERMAEKAKRLLPDAEVALHVEGALPLAPLSVTMKRNLRLFSKEIIHNCAKHASADVFEIGITSVDNECRLIFRDNGIGFDPNLPSEGLGLESLKERGDEMGGVVEIISTPGDGATIQLVFSSSKHIRSGFRKRGPVAEKTPNYGSR